MDETILRAFFDGWSGLIRILAAAPVLYLGVIASVRISGKRSTSQMNNFDWIVTVAIGSITASGVVLENVTVLEAILAVALLIAFQWTVTFSMLRSKLMERIFKAEPRLMVQNGRFLRAAMYSERIAESEIRAALRENGLTSVEQAQWVILETDASLSVIQKSSDDLPISAIESVAGFHKD